ncbi:MAG: hypothetical protein KME15_20575 [Drouetiella hepatica Uher 2000/2452]|jgi:hypothetical protein|uniref:Uncharacterized protein n=1 Tax=Drouetiella hepatica Uher 2000/2452 TaxID=904376 RepID=A0A951QD58_9CYAN|nr:hypothetical protein [Drouetiella hepatica Uher 2000/2452]
MVYATAQTVDINFSEFAIELSEFQRSITRFLDAVDLGTDPQPSFDLLIWQINNLANLYS